MERRARVMTNKPVFENIEASVNFPPVNDGWSEGIAQLLELADAGRQIHYPLVGCQAAGHLVCGRPARSRACVQERLAGQVTGRSEPERRVVSHGRCLRRCVLGRR